MVGTGEVSGWHWGCQWSVLGGQWSVLGKAVDGTGEVNTGEVNGQYWGCLWSVLGRSVDGTMERSILGRSVISTGEVNGQYWGCQCWYFRSTLDQVELSQLTSVQTLQLAERAGRRSVRPAPQLLPGQ